MRNNFVSKVSTKVVDIVITQLKSRFQGLYKIVDIFKQLEPVFYWIERASSKVD